MVLLHILLEGLGLPPEKVPATEDVARIIKKMVLYKKSPEKAAKEIAKLIKDNMI